MKHQLHKAICKHLPELDSWFQKKSSDLSFPFYSSFDIRNSKEKIAPVDANIYPAGFNNICQADKECTVDLIKNYLQENHTQLKSKILLLCEEHTKNIYYWENIITLKKLISEAGYEVKISMPSPLKGEFEVKSFSGETLTINPIKIINDKISLEGFLPELVICNNDFSQISSEWEKKLGPPINPPPQMGWYKRKKSDFFQFYNQLAEEFCEIIKLNPESLTIKTERFNNFDVSDEESKKKLINKVNIFIGQLKQTASDPFVFIKNNSGTYGLGIERVKSGDDILDWNYKSRKKMKASKGGGGFSDVIIQEGIPTLITNEKETAEISIYTIGSQLSGGFLRAHQKKGPTDNLNSVGAIYKKLCLSDLNISTHDLPEENVYGWIAKIGSLSIAKEMQKQGLQIN